MVLAEQLHKHLCQRQGAVGVELAGGRSRRDCLFSLQVLDEDVRETSALNQLRLSSLPVRTELIISDYFPVLLPAITSAALQQSAGFS